MKRLGLVILFFLTVFSVRADDVNFKVTCKRQVVVGEQFQVSYELNCDGSDFKAPNFNDFEVVGGPFSSVGSNVQIINGSVTKSHTLTYSFYLRAIKEGKYTIPAATITVKNKKVKSESTVVEVVKGDTDSNGDNSKPSTVGKEALLEATVNKKSAYIGEQIILTYKIYYIYNIVNPMISKSPSYSGFWTKDISDNNGVLHSSSVIKNGIEYHVVTAQEIVLIPQKTGKLIIDPLDISCVVQIKTENKKRNSYDPYESFFGDILGQSYTNVKKELRSQPIEIEVKPTPVNGKPNSFTGAVGQFTFTSKIDKTEMKSNDAFTITYSVSGKGNIELLDIPEPVLPPDFEPYAPQITSNVKNNSYGLSGTKKAEYTVIPRVSGDFTLEPVEFTYFDPEKNKYVTLQSDSYTLKVERSANEGSSGIIYAGGQEAIKVVGSDILHITNDGKLRKSGTLLFASPLYFILIISIIALFSTVFVIYKKINKFNNNQVLVRNKRATKIAKKRLQNAFNYLKIKDQGHFYEEFSQALWGYISDKLNISRSNLSIDTVKEIMSGKNVPEDIINQFIELLNSCEYARFAPGDPGKKMEDLYERGLEVITKAEKNLG